MYRTAPQLVFQFIGGFSITQYAYPILRDVNATQPDAFTFPSASASSSVEATGSLWGKLKWSVHLGGGNGRHRVTSLSEDVEAMVRGSPGISSVVLALIVGCGGAPALVGAGLSIYCGDGPEGVSRYDSLKQKLRGLSKA